MENWRAHYNASSTRLSNIILITIQLKQDYSVNDTFWLQKSALFKENGSESKLERRFLD